ncbi:transcription factor TFIIIB subunit brf1 [Allomyces javanicus]|nr:transcription factor TFIIIB subunit brf1 [Allomyces javanicus]
MNQRPQSAAAQPCPTDGGAHSLVEDAANGQTVCEKCGLVTSENNTTAEVAFVEGGDGRHIALGARVTAANAGRVAGPGGFISNSNNAAHKAGKELQRLLAALNIVDNVGGPENSIVNTAHRIYKLASTHAMTKGRPVARVCAVCLYIALRQRKLGVLLIELADLVGTSVFKLGTLFSLFRREFPSVVQLDDSDPSMYVARFAGMLDFGNKTTDVANDAMKLVVRMKRDWISDGRRPAGICGACLLIAARMHGFHRSVKEIVHVVKMSDVTVVARLREFQKTPAAHMSATELRAWATAVQEAKEKRLPVPETDQFGLPPAFVRNRIRENPALAESVGASSLSAPSSPAMTAASPAMTTSSSTATDSPAALALGPTEQADDPVRLEQYILDFSTRILNTSGADPDDRVHQLLAQNAAVAAAGLAATGRSTPDMISAAASAAAAATASGTVLPAHAAVGVGLGIAGAPGNTSPFLTPPMTQQQGGGSSGVALTALGADGTLPLTPDATQLPSPASQAEAVADASSSSSRTARKPKRTRRTPEQELAIMTQLAETIPRNPAVLGEYRPASPTLQVEMPASHLQDLRLIKPLTKLLEEKETVEQQRAAFADCGDDDDDEEMMLPDDEDEEEHGASSSAAAGTTSAAPAPPPPPPVKKRKPYDLDPDRGRVHLTEADMRLSDLDDDEEIQAIFATPAEVEVRAKIWNEANREYLEQQMQKAMDKQRKAAEGGRPRSRKRKRTATAGEPLAESPFEAAHRLAKKRISSKINEDVLRQILGDGDMSPTMAGFPTGDGAAVASSSPSGAVGVPNAGSDAREIVEEDNMHVDGAGAAETGHDEAYDEEYDEGGNHPFPDLYGGHDEEDTYDEY